MALVACAGLWMAAIAGGWKAMIDYELTDAPLLDVDADVGDAWPADSPIVFAAGRPTLVVFVHPKCPCSKSTVGELAELLARLRRAAAAVPNIAVVITTPADPDLSWTDSSLVKQCRKLPDAHVFIDRGGVEADRFDAATSGVVMLFDGAGRRCFVGGVTPGRGRRGMSAGAARLQDLLVGSTTASPRETCPVFGCRLVSPKLDLAERAASRLRDHRQECCSE